MVPTLIEPDVILGMDLLQQLRVKIDTKAGVGEPTVLVSCVQPLETWWIPARKSMVFPIRNPLPEKSKNKMFFLNLVINCPQLSGEPLPWEPARKSMCGLRT